MAAYSYDLNGNLVQKSEKGVVWQYMWDAENRLVEVKNSSGLVVNYGYFDNGNRANKTVIANGVKQSQTIYVHDGDEVIAEYNSSGALLRE